MLSEAGFLLLLRIAGRSCAKEAIMNWTAESSTVTNSIEHFSDLDTTVGKAGASESVAIVAIIWGVVIIL